MRKIVPLFFALFFLSGVTPEEALVVSQAWTRGAVIKQEPVYFKGKLVGFVSRLERGFVLVPSSRYLPPVKLYSYTREFDPSNPIIKDVLWELYMEESFIEAIPDFKSILDRKRGILAWISFKDGKVSEPVSRNPLLKTHWDQDYPYNYYAPLLGGKRTYAGCVAVAFGQIMKFWTWPGRGRGSHSYSWRGRVLSANFDYPYSWGLMPEKLTPASPMENIKAVAILLYHLGVAFNMDYGIEGSSAYASDAVKVLPGYFKYSRGIKYLSRSSYTSKEWYARMVWERELKRPFEFTICSEKVCHAAVVDGYTKTEHEFLIHINFGWSGSFDGYYSPDNIEAGYSFTKTEWQEMVVSIFPEGKLFPPDSLKVSRYIDRGVFLKRFVDKVKMGKSPTCGNLTYRLYRKTGTGVELIWEGSYTPVIEVFTREASPSYAASVVGEDGVESQLTPFVSPETN